MMDYGSIENEDPENEDPLRKRRPPTKTKTSDEDEDPFIFVGNDFNITLLGQNWWITAVYLEIDPRE